jgi:hypothetical protein
VQIINKHHRPAGGHGLEQPDQSLGEHRGGVGHRGQHILITNPARKHPRQDRPYGCKLLLISQGCRRPGKCLNERAVSSAGFDSSALQDQYAAPFGLALRLDQQSGFSYSGLAAKQHSLALTSCRSVDCARQHRQLGASSNQRQVHGHGCIVVQMNSEPQRPLEAEKARARGYVSHHRHENDRTNFADHQSLRFSAQVHKSSQNPLFGPSFCGFVRRNASVIAPVNRRECQRKSVLLVGYIRTHLGYVAPSWLAQFISRTQTTNEKES